MALSTELVSMIEKAKNKIKIQPAKQSNSKSDTIIIASLFPKMIELKRIMVNGGLM